MSNRSGSSTRGSADATDRDRPELPSAPTRQRQLWNFLTWSFFLSQVLAAESFLGSAAHAGAETDDGRAANAGAETPMSGQAQALAGVNEAGNEVGPGQPGTSELITPLDRNLDSLRDGWSEAAVQTGHGEPRTIAAVADIGFGVGEQIGQASEGLPAPPLVGSLDGPVGALAGVLGDALNPVLNAVDGALGTVESLVDHVLSPVIGSVGDVVDLLGGAIEHGLDPVVTTVVGTAETLLGDVVGPLDGAAGNALAPLLGGVDGLLGPLDGLLGHAPAIGGATTADRIEASAEHATAPLLATAGEALEPVDGILSPLAGIADALGVTASPGSIVLPGAPALSQPLDDLFSKGVHTAYNLAINALPSALAANGTAHAPVESMLDAALAPGADAGDHGHAPGQHGVLQHALEELHLRGFNDGMAL